MKNKILSLILFSITIVFLTISSVMALEQEIVETDNDELTAYKETIKNENKVGEYEVQISVPGKEGVEKHDEVILMVDGSYSMDNEWPQMKNAIIEIGKSFLNGTGNTQLTLMAFGMGDNEVLTHIRSVEELETALGELPGTLLYGRSSTNCEAGFTGVTEYIKNHDETLNDVHVIFISDGNINTDETPYTFYNWKENSWLRRTPEVLATWSLSVEVEHILAGGNPSEAFKTIFGDNADAETILENATEEQIMAWADLVWDEVYANSNLIKEKAYPVSDAERAFVDYDNKYGTHIQEAFYYALWGRSYPDRWSRTPLAANELALMDKVTSLYLVDYDSYSSWMDTGINSEKAQFIQSQGISGLITALEGIITDLSTTTYHNSVITDYTSKWVSPLDTNNDGIFDEKDITVIYNGEIQENANITVLNLTTMTEEELLNLPLEEQEKIKDLLTNNPDLNENTNNSIYRIKWFIKEGMLKASDRYVLTYKVKVDTIEEGYESTKDDYKANAKVELTYEETKTTEETETITKPGIVIKEDPVKQQENIITITKTDEEGNLLVGSDFELSSNETANKIIKEYSLDGITWYNYDLENFNYNAAYFRFKGLYDYQYTLSEIKTPKGYKGIENKTYDFTNQEGQNIKETIINIAIKGKVIIHYVVKVGENYIPFNEFAYDENGNLLSIFENKNIEDIILVENIETEFQTNYETIESLTLNGLYVGNLITDSENLNKLEKNIFVGKFKENTQEFTYVYEPNIGNGSDEEYPMPPQTGYNFNTSIIYTILIYIIIVIKKAFV